MALRDVVARAKHWRWLESSSTVSTVADTQTAALPSNVKYPGRLRPVTAEIQYPDYVDWNTFEYLYPRTALVDTPSGTPTAWSMYAGSFYFYPIPDAVYQYTFYFWVGPTALSGESDTAPIPLEHEDVLVYGALMFLAAHDKDPAMMSYWQNMYEGQIRELKAHTEFKQYETIRKAAMPSSYHGGYDS
ncbi:MAG: hypothetical protein OJJ55_19095 [Rhodococcus sp.]|nr:hypothetical protein [Rhodococcus sp. (in: high G+C Gram-positive bacteria)]